MNGPQFRIAEPACVFKPYLDANPSPSRMKSGQLFSLRKCSFVYRSRAIHYTARHNKSRSTWLIGRTEWSNRLKVISGVFPE